MKDEEPAEKIEANTPESYIIIKRKLDNKSVLGACLFGAGMISMLSFLFFLSFIQ